MTILSLAPPLYLPYLQNLLLNSKAPHGKVTFVRQKVESLEQAAGLATGGVQVECVVNATGLGAKSLGGCMDELVEPIR